MKQKHTGWVLPSVGPMSRQVQGVAYRATWCCGQCCSWNTKTGLEFWFCKEPEMGPLSANYSRTHSTVYALRSSLEKSFIHVQIEFSVYINNSYLEATTNGKVYSEHLWNKSFIDFLDFYIPFHFRKYNEFDCSCKITAKKARGKW